MTPSERLDEVFLLSQQAINQEIEAIKSDLATDDLKAIRAEQKRRENNQRQTEDNGLFVTEEKARELRPDLFV